MLRKTMEAMIMLLQRPVPADVLMAAMMTADEQRKQRGGMRKRWHTQELPSAKL